MSKNINVKPIDNLPLHHIPVLLSESPKVTAEIYPNYGENIITRNVRVISTKELCEQMKEKSATIKPEQLESIYKEMKLVAPPKFIQTGEIPTIDSKFVGFEPRCLINTGKGPDKTGVTFLSMDIIKSRPINNTIKGENRDESNTTTI